MKKSTPIWTGAGVMVLGLLIAATPRFLFKVCEFQGTHMMMSSASGGAGHMYMPCHYTALASYMLGFLIFMMGGTLLLARTGEAASLLAIVLGGAAIAVILTPIVFPICADPNAPCNHGTKPMLMVLGLVTLIASGWLGLTSRRPAANNFSDSVAKATSSRLQKD